MYRWFDSFVLSNREVTVVRIPSMFAVLISYSLSNVYPIFLFLSFVYLRIYRAWICLPNVWLLSFGKYLFSLIDIIIGYLIYQILKLRGLSHTKALLYASLFLYSPITVNVSTRGNADSLVCALVLGTVYLLIMKKNRLAAIMYGLAVHMKIYPIIYALPLVFFLDENYQPSDFPITLRNNEINHHHHNNTTNKEPTTPLLSKSIGTTITDFVLYSLRWIYRFCTWRRIEFGLVSGSTFLLLTGIYYYIYGYVFLYETYLYHFIRADNRHNFSAYFYDIYLRYDLPAARTGTGLLSFIPQFGTVLLLGGLFYRDLLFCLFIQTLTFVTFNKVITAQYFQWYLSLLPFLLPQTLLTWKHGLGLSLLWLGPELLSNYWSNELENKGQSVFLYIWYSDLLFFSANIFILSILVIKHVYSPIFIGGRLVLMNNPEDDEQRANEILQHLLNRPSTVDHRTPTNNNNNPTNKTGGNRSVTSSRNQPPTAAINGEEDEEEIEQSLPLQVYKEDEEEIEQEEEVLIPPPKIQNTSSRRRTASSTPGKRR